MRLQLALQVRAWTGLVTSSEQLFDSLDDDHAQAFRGAVQLTAQNTQRLWVKSGQSVVTAQHGSAQFRQLVEGCCWQR
jgi:hypothetical protein